MPHPAGSRRRFGAARQLRPCEVEIRTEDLMDRLLVPLDGSLTAEAVLPHVRKILARKDSDVLLVRIVPPPIPEGAALALNVWEGAAREYLAGLRERLERQGVRARAVVRVGEPVSEILRVAAEDKSTMIAMATHGATGLRRALFGSVAEALLRRTDLPVLLVRPFWSYELLERRTAPPRPFRRILVPFDTEALSRAALPAVTELADLFDASLYLVHVRDPRNPERDPAHLKDLASELKNAAIPVQLRTPEGAPGIAILEAAERDGIDLIAMATHGRRGLQRWLKGSVTEHVLRHATVPLLVVRAAERKRSTGSPRKTGAEVH